MTTVTTKAMAKVAAVATGLAMATSMLSLAPMAHAAALSSAQVSSILSLLSSFGADASTIANVQASLTGGTPSSTTTTTTTTSSAFTRDLTVGSTGADVTALQTTLISKGYLSGSATGYFGAMTKAAVAQWQTAAGVTPAAGYFGARSRAAFGGSSTTTTTGPSAGTGTGLKVMLSPTSPNGTVLVQGQGIGVLGDYTFSNPTSAPINVTSISFMRTGVSNDATLANVYLYNGGTRLTDSAGVSSSAFNYSDPVAIFTVPAGQTYTVSVRSDIATGTSGQQIGVSLVSVNSNGTLDSSVSLPIMSGYQTISAASLATVSYANTTSPSTTTISPQNDFPVWQNTISVSTNPVKLSSMRFTNLGSIDSAYISNLRLVVDGVQAGSAVASMGTGRTVTFDISANPVTLSTSSHTIKVLANITGGASRTIQLSVQRSSDAMFVDSQLNQPVTPLKNSTTFSAVTSAGAITINSVSGASGVSVSLDPASPTQAVAVGSTNVEWARFNMLASGENVKVSDLYVYATYTNDAETQNVGGLANGKILVNGVQVGSTKAIVASTTAAGTDFSLGSSLILPAGQTTIVSVYGDAKDTNNRNIVNNATVSVTLVQGSSNGQGQSSLNSVNVPATNSTSNAITVSTSSLTATKATGYGAQTVVAGTNNAKIGAFTLSSGSTEGVTVNTIAISMIAANAASITNLTLKDESTGQVLGNIITTPSGITGGTISGGAMVGFVLGSNNNSFNVNLDIPRSSSKNFGIYANVLSGANPGGIITVVDSGTAGIGMTTGISASVATQATLQTITVGNGTLGVATSANDPVNSNVLAGASSVMVGEFKFTAANSWYTVNNLAILVPNSAATSVTNVTVKYKDVNNVLQTQTQPLTLTTATYPFATATFTGLGMYVPSNGSAPLSVYVGTTVFPNATSGAAINVKLDTGNASTAIDNTFLAQNSSGSTLTVVNSGTVVASNGTAYVRKAIPTFALVNTNVNGTAVPSTGTPLYKFSITADGNDPSGAVEWSKLVFNISTTTATVGATQLYLTDDASGNNLLDNNTTSASSTGSVITIDLTKNATPTTGKAKYAQVGVGQTKTYNLYGSVSGYGAAGSTVTISLAPDATVATANGSADTTAVVASAGTVNTIWSDSSATNHTVSTSDWTNGYLLKNFTNNAISYSK